jgi:hypothetical protein
MRIKPGSAWTIEGEIATRKWGAFVLRLNMKTSTAGLLDGPPEHYAVLKSGQYRAMAPLFIESHCAAADGWAWSLFPPPGGAE